MRAVTGFEAVRRVARHLSGLAVPWWVAGGWAVDLYLGRVTRPHADVEVAVLREDQDAVRAYLEERGWELRKAIPRSGGRTEPWLPGERLELPVHEVHARRPAGDPGRLEVLLNERAGDRWVFRRHPAVTLPLRRLGGRTPDGIPYLSPEVVLLYKAGHRRPHDEADFAALAGRLPAEVRAWLRAALADAYGPHPWLGRLRAGRRGRPETETDGACPGEAGGG